MVVPYHLYGFKFYLFAPNLCLMICPNMVTLDTKIMFADDMSIVLSVTSNRKCLCDYGNM